MVNVKKVGTVLQTYNVYPKINQSKCNKSSIVNLISLGEQAIIFFKPWHYIGLYPVHLMAVVLGHDNLCPFYMVNDMPYSKLQTSQQ
jgi:hypothetical protein